jgi:hypothetical protein
MTLPARQADLNTAQTDLMNAVRNCDTDINANDPDTLAIQRIKEQAMAALGELGFNSTEPT